MDPHTTPTAPPSAGHSPLVAVEWDAEGRVVRWPAEAEALFGWRADEVLGKSLEEWPFVHPDDRESVRRTTRELVRGATRQNLSINRNLTRDGRTIHCEWYNTAVLDGAGQLGAQLSLVLDVTARERAFAEMQAARAAAERADERTRGLQWVTAALSEALTPPAVTRVVVEQAIVLLGAASAVVVLLDGTGEWLDLVGSQGYAPEVLESWKTFSRHAPVPLADTVRDGEPIVLRSLEERARRYPHLAAAQGYPAILAVPLSVEGEVLGALGLGFADERALGDEEVALAMALGRQCAQAVRRANLYHAEREARREVESLGERLNLALASADVGTWDFDPVSGALSWDARCRTIMGLPGDAPVDYAAFRAALHPDDREQTDEAVERALDPSGTGEYASEYRTVAADGTTRWALARGRAFFEGEGRERRAVRFIGTIIDNTERKVAEAERERLVGQLRTERERLAEVFARAPVSISVLRGPELRIELANELALTLGNRRGVVGMTVREAFPELEEQGFFELLDAVMATGRPFHGRDLPVRFTYDGVVRNAFFDVTCHPLLDADGEVEGIITLHFDVTERVHARRRMELLAEAGTALAVSSDPAGVLGALVRIAVARLAPACAVFLAAAHGAAGQAEAAIRSRSEVHFHDVPLPEALAPDHPVSRALATGRAERLDAEDGSVAALFGEGEWAGGAVLPMRLDGRTIGAVVLASGAGDEWGAEELMMAEELVRRAALAVERARLYERALAANLAKSQFLATMSHEIRTPINAVMGYAELLEIGVGGPLSPQQGGYVERIRYSSHHLLGLINDILDLAKVEAGELRFARGPVSADEVMSSVVAMVIPQAEAKGVRLAAEACASGAELLGDGDRVRQVLLNLVSNAVKFTHAGGRVTVRCGASAEPPPGALLPGTGPWGFVEVADTGIGVPEDELSRIFDPFTQVDGTHTRAQGGTGLGLAISRTFARRMGGEVTAWSRPGEGSVFTLWLPAVQEAVERAPAPVARPVPGLASVGRVLEERVEEVLAAWTQRIGREPALPHARGVEWVLLEDHAATFLVEVARALMALDAGGGEPALMRDGESIMRTVARLHGAQRARLGFSEDELRLEYRILFEEAERLLRHHVGALTDSDPGPALAVVRRLVDDAAEVAMEGHTVPAADAIVAEAHRVIDRSRETVRRLRAQVGGRRRKRPRGDGRSG